MSDHKRFVEHLIKQAANAHDAGDAMKYSQAALNAANAVCALASLPIEMEPTNDARSETQVNDVS
jgi:hypothetical protein